MRVTVSKRAKFIKDVRFLVVVLKRKEVFCCVAKAINSFQLFKEDYDVCTRMS